MIPPLRLITALACLSSAPAFADVVLSESFDYSAWNTGSAPMNEKWSAVSGSSISLAAGVAGTAFPTTYLSLGNSVVSEELARPIRNDFELSVSILHSTTSRYQWVALLNDEGKGYGFGWDAAGSATGQGFVNLRRFDAAPTYYGSTGVKITTPAASGHVGVTLAASATPATFTLRWTSATHTLALLQDGIVRTSITDSSLDYARFSRVYLAGNTSGYFDDLVVKEQRVNVTAHGVVPDAPDDQTSAIVQAVAAAKAAGVPLYFPAGTYRYQSFTLDGVDLVGAGADNTVLLAPNPALQEIKLAGVGPAVRDIALLTQPTGRVSGQDALNVLGTAIEFEISGVKIDGSNATAIFVGGAKQGRITANRVVNTKADGIHITAGANALYVAGNLVRNTGDDCIAVVSYLHQPQACRDVLIENNDVGEQFGGRGLTVVGGLQVTVRNNTIRNSTAAGLYVASEGSYNTYGVSDTIIASNILDGCPYDLTGNGHRAITLASTNGLWVEDIWIEGNQVLSSISGPIKVGASGIRDVECINNSFPPPANATGSANAMGAVVTSAVLGGKTVPAPSNVNSLGEQLSQSVFAIPSGNWHGKTLGELALRPTTGSRVVTLWQSGVQVDRPGNQEVIHAGDTMLITGTSAQFAAVQDRLTNG